MRVLVLTNMYPTPADRSFGTFVHQQVRALRGLGVEVDVLFVDGRASKANYVSGYTRFWRQIRHVRYDLVHAHYVFSGMIARAQRHLPVVQSFHGAGEMHGYQGRLCRRLAPLVDAAIVTSPDHKERLGYEPARIIPCGVDFEQFSPRSQQEARAELGWPVDGRVIIWVGDPRPEKRVDLAAAAAATVAERDPSVRFELICRVPHSTVPTYLNAADVLILSSEDEGSPVIIKEAMACNLPIVSTAVGDVPAIMQGVEGCHLADANPQSLAEKLVLALDRQRPTAGRDAIAHLSTEAEARQIIDVYHGVLDTRARDGGRRR